MSAPTGTLAAKPPLPELRQDVVITLPDRDAVPRPRLEGDGRGDRRRADARSTRRDPLALGDASPMVVEFPAPRGLVRLEGRGTVATHDLVRFHHEGAVDVVQRRDFVRVARRAPARSSRDVGERRHARRVGRGVDGQRQRQRAARRAVRTRSPSATRSPSSLTPNDGEPPIAGRGRVARIGEDGQRGIAIEQLDRDARRQLVRFVFEQERIARQRTRDGEL